jgi:MATE family multidrug resistance protein
MSDTPRRHGGTLGALLRLAGAVFVGQIAVIGFGVADTAMLGRSADTAGLATLALGQAIYITLYVTLAESMQALLPVLARAHGEANPSRLRSVFGEGLWLAVALALPGVALLLWPQPLLALGGHANDPNVLGYLRVQALALPAALLFRAHVALAQSIARPLLVTVLQLGALLVKLALNALLLAPGAFGLHRFHGLGALGCALATCVTQWLLLGAAVLQHRGPLRELAALRRHLPSLSGQWELLRLGLPIGAAVLFEVSSFTGMALFIAHLGQRALAAHQIAASLASLLYMAPLSLAIASSTLVAQRLGAGDHAGARHAAMRGVGAALALGLLLTALVGGARGEVVALYTDNAAVRPIARHLLLFIAAYQVFDAVQVCCAFALRAWHVALLPSALYALALWGGGLGGGYLLAFDPLHRVPASLHGPAGFWLGNGGGLALTALSLLWLLQRVSRR